LSRAYLTISGVGIGATLGRDAVDGSVVTRTADGLDPFLDRTPQPHAPREGNLLPHRDVIEHAGAAMNDHQSC
jgi:hypothetical protein